MLPRRTTRLAGARSAPLALIVSLLLVVGCGDGGSSADDPPATTTTARRDEGTTTSAAAATTSVPGTTDTTGLDGEGISELEALAAQLLVLGAELGVPAEDQGYTPAGPTDCGFDLDEDEPADVHVGTSLLTPNGTFEEVLRVYADTDTAMAAFDASVEHEAECTFTDRRVTGPEAVNDRVGADEAVRFSASDPSGTTVRVVARVADAVVIFSLSGQVDVVLDPLDVAAFGVGKIVAALEA